MNESIYDYIIIGSDFGGSVAAMRLAEKGYRVLVLEQGKRYRNEDFPKTNWALHKYIWAPALRWFGFQKLTAFKEVFILSGVGVGGGSLVYAATHMVPPDAFFQNPVWAHFRDWNATLMPFYEKARFMLGSTRNPAFYSFTPSQIKPGKEMDYFCCSSEKCLLVRCDFVSPPQIQPGTEKQKLKFCILGGGTQGKDRCVCAGDQISYLLISSNGL